MKRTILVIDLGSSSVRALLFDEQLQPISGAVSSRQHDFTTAPPGAAVADAEHLRALSEACLDDILDHPAAAQIDAVGMATFVGNVLGMNGRGQAITPVYTYADRRSAADVALLRDQIELTASHQRTGCLHHTAYHPARLHWLRRTEPERFAQVVQWLDLGSYLYGHWFGRAAPCSYSVASWSGLLDRHTLQWDGEWFKTLDLEPATFPPLADYTAAQMGLSEAYARRWPTLRDVPFFLAVGDGAAANIGLGAVDPHCIALTVGTTAALRVVTTAAEPPVPDGLWGYRVDGRHHLIGGATSEGGNIFQWAGEVLQLNGADIEAHLAQAEADGHGLTFLPLLAGERSPGWATEATGGLVGLRLSTTPLDILQAALEGVAIRLAIIAGQLKSVTTDKATVLAGGGALIASPGWAQIITNALDRPLHLIAETETTARGVALLIWHALGRGSPADHSPSIAQTLRPQPRSAAALRVALERQMDLYRKLIAA